MAAERKLHMSTRISLYYIQSVSFEGSLLMVKKEAVTSRSASTTKHDNLLLTARIVVNVNVNYTWPTYRTNSPSLQVDPEG